MKKHLLAVCAVLALAGLVTSIAFAAGVQKTERPVSRSVYPAVTYGPPLEGTLSALDESFEGTTFPPAGWVKLSPDGGPGWNRQVNGTTPIPGWTGGTITVPPGGGSATAFATWNTGGSSRNDQWLVTPQLTNVLANDSLKFYLRIWPNSFDDTVEVRISTTTPTVPGFTTLVATLAFVAPSGDTTWRAYGYRLSDFVATGSNIYIGFREKVADNINDGAAVSLDMVRVTVGGGGTSAPTVVTSPAYGISTTGAILNGSVNPNGLATTYTYEYGLTTSYGSTVGPTSVGSGTSPVTVPEPISGLDPGTLYHFRLKAQNSLGTTLGDDRTFTTSTGGGGGCSAYSSAWCAPGAYPDLPGPTYFQASAWLGDTLFVHAPSGGAAGTSIVRYTPGAGWTTGDPLPSPKVGGTLTRWKNRLYYIGGGSSAITTGSTDVYAYTPGAGWAAKASMPAALAGHGAVCWRDSIIFVIGGPYTGSGTNLAVHYYDPNGDAWGTITNSLPSGQGRRTFGLGISGDKIVMAAGYNTAFLKSVYVGTVTAFDAITWTAAPAVPTVYAGLSRPGGAAYGALFFLVGGERAGAGGYYDTTHVYNINTNAWVTLINNKPIKMSNIFNAVTLKCVGDTIRLYVPGGYGNATAGGTGVAQSVFDVIGCGAGLPNDVPEPVAEIPSSFALEQNYPNPFNPATTFRFSLPERNAVSLKVYNLLGQEVTAVVDAELDAGTYTVRWNAGGLASGVYLYRLSAGQYVETRKLMLLK
ncbi:MAG: choice-of-anchor J domain-containing protein [Bacteroidota bacterium]